MPIAEQLERVLQATPTRRESKESAISQWLLYSFAAICSVAIWFGLRQIQGAGNFPLDDSYITLHAAQSLHLGYDPNSPGVSPMFGATSAPFLGLTYLLLYVFTPLTALTLASWLGVLTYSLALARICADRKLRAHECVALLVVGLGAGVVPMHLLNGLETSWALAGVAWTLALAQTGTPFKFAIVAGLAASLRPDLFVFSVCMVVAAAIARGWNRKQIGLVAALALLPIAITSLCYLHATGLPYPPTATAKRYFFAEEHRPLAGRIGTELREVFGFALMCGPFAIAPFFTLRSIIGRANLIFTGLLIAGATVTPGSLAWNYNRYLVPLAAVMAWSLTEAFQSRKTTRRIWFASSALWVVVLLPFILRAHTKNVGIMQRDMQAQAKWCRLDFPANAIVLVHDVGYISYATPFRIVDMVGLKTPSAIPLNRAITWPTEGKDRALEIARLARQSHAGYLILLKGWLNMDQVPEQLRQTHWSVQPLPASGSYFIFRIQPPS